MKMGDGGFRPAYNVQFATDGDARMIVAVDVTNNGSDGGQLAPLHEHVCQRYGKVPDNYTVDGGFSTVEDITAVEQRGSRVAAPMTHDDRITMTASRSAEATRTPVGRATPTRCSPSDSA